MASHQSLPPSLPSCPPEAAHLVVEPGEGQGPLAMARVSAEVPLGAGIVGSDSVFFVGLGKGLLRLDALERAAQKVARALEGARVVLLLEAPELAWARAVAKGASAARAWEELAEALGQAMAWAGQACSRGLGVGWGVSSEAMVYPLDGERCLEIDWVMGLGGEETMEVVELPLNLLEPWAVTKGVVARAHGAGLKVLASRVLRGLFGRGVFELVEFEAPEPPSPGQLAKALERIRKLKGGLGEVLGEWVEELVGPRVWQARVAALESEVEALGEGEQKAVREVIELGLAIQQAAAAALARRLVRLVGGLGVEVAGRRLEELAVGLVGATEGIWGVVVEEGLVDEWPAVGCPQGLWQGLEVGIRGLGSELGRVGRL